MLRFGLLVGAIGLLVFLILFQQALQDGLITSFVGAIRNQSAPVLVFNVDGQRTLQGSLIPPSMEEAVRSLDEVGAVAELGQSTFTVEVEGGEETDAAIVGTDDQDLFRPTTLSDGRRPVIAGEAVGSDADFEVGDTVSVVATGGSGRVDLQVVGTAEDVQLSVTPTLFTDLGTFDDAVRAVNPDAGEILPNGLAVEPAEGITASATVSAINDASSDAEALTRTDAANESPGVAQVRQSFSLIFLLYGLVVPLVTGLFFLILTLQKAGSLTLLRAIGAKKATLARALVIQVLIVVGLSLVLGIGMYFPLSQSRVGGLSLRFDVTTVVFWSALLLVLGLVSAAVSLRRVLRIDPIDATVGGGVR